MTTHRTPSFIIRVAHLAGGYLEIFPQEKQRESDSEHNTETQPDDYNQHCESNKVNYYSSRIRKQ